MCLIGTFNLFISLTHLQGCHKGWKGWEGWEINAFLKNLEKFFTMLGGAINPVFLKKFCLLRSTFVKYTNESLKFLAIGGRI